MTLPATRVFDTSDRLVRALADALVQHAASALRAHGRFHLVLAGGSTPRALYAELARRGVGGAEWQVWYGDERCLPHGDPARNSTMAEDAWLAASPIPALNYRPVDCAAGAEAAAAGYAARLAGVPDFDLVLLGVGEDGHTASLFPGRNWDGADVLAVREAPKPPPDRVSLSASRLSRAQAVWFVVTGAGKRDALARWAAGEKLPAAAVRGRATTLVWLDRLALPD